MNKVRLKLLYINFISISKIYYYYEPFSYSKIIEGNINYEIYK